MTAALQVDEIHTYYGESYILQGVSLRVLPGRLVAVLGRNGMGKTTLIRSVMGFTPPRRGAIYYEGREITALPSHAIAQQGIGLVPQGRRIFPSLSVLENLTVAARRGARDGWTLEHIFDVFPRLRERAHHRGNKLSGGEQQMLAIARALMTNPRFLIMDEPSEGLAPLLVQDLARILLELKQQGLSMLMVEQNLALALRLADHVYVMSKGRVVFDGDPERLQAEDEIRQRYLGV
ncbi:MAG: ABC transporter ATP-binding protein [Armatimonadota bacterium]|nr:ABC transporter ATP-binding protein [Armatimonadota bacterium]MDR7450612.1 ABC transporter ATP-binding protein [Armatimonadota bacterium]MDR7466255.1 ABC transporter ATP-binding protein [Armatimonadota bacterium]MDR7492976.1 ABC transporter ATP-binding protein [Armatimonadota bacterium]MDR7498267.1 ABC transporter ATP-binding protein [Armatimonadota bacterium]